MGARGRDRTRGRALALGWDEAAPPAGQGAPTDRPVGAPGAAGGDDPGPAPAPRGLSRLTRRSRRLIAACAVLAVVGALLIALPRLLGATSGPEQATAEFLQAVVDGDLETVRAHLPDAPSPGAAALTAEILAGAENRLESFEIQHVEVNAGTAAVTAELRTGSDRAESTFTLTSTETDAFSPTVWELAPVALPERQIDLTFGVQEIEIEGVTLPVVENLLNRETYEPRVSLQLLPGTYEVTLPEVTPWTEAPQLTLEVPPGFGTSEVPLHKLPLTITEAGQNEVQDQIDAALEDCMASTSSVPEGCPFEAPGTAERGTGDDAAPPAGQGTWSLTSSPQVVLVPVSAFLWMVVGDGAATFTPAGGAEPIEVRVSVLGIAAIDGHGVLEAALSSDVPIGTCTDAETGAVIGASILEEPEQELLTECG